MHALTSLILIFAFIAQKSEQNGGEPFTQRTVDFYDVLTSLEKVIEFYSQNVDKVNLDSVFGIRIGQGALSKAMDKLEPSNQNQLFMRMRDMYSNLVRIAEKGFSFLKSTDSEYFHKFEQLINRKWFTMLAHHSVNMSMVHKITLHDDDSFDGRASDKCMTDLIGSQTTGPQQKCKITDDCLDLMTMKGADSYHLTHQGLFLLLAETKGCRTEIMKKFGNDKQWEHQIGYMGANIYYQMRKTYEEDETGNDEIGKDLFTEQVLVCQMLGVVECFDVMFLDAVLRLQDDSGCWKQKSKEDEEDQQLELLQRTNTIEEEVDEGEKESYSSTKFIGRTLKEDVTLEDGCSAHFTGVAIGCVSLYAYWFSSHPEIVNMNAEIANTVEDNTDYIRFTENNKDFLGELLFTIRWVLIFLLALVFFYYFRKMIRKPVLALRKKI